MITARTKPPMSAALQRPVRVCFMIDNLDTAGVEKQLLLLIRWLDRSRVEPYLALLDGNNERSRSLEPRDCPVLRLGVRSLRRPSNIVGAVRLARFLRGAQIDVFHPLFHDSMYFGAPIAKLAGIPCVAGLRVNVGYWMKPVDRLLVRFYRRLVDATVANCEACRESAVANEGTRRESIVIIANGLDLERFALPAQTAENSADSAPRRVGLVANLRPVKNVELFVRAAGKLAARYSDVQFEVAGEGELRPALEALIRALGLTDRLKLLGVVQDIPAFLRGLDVGVLCSHSEGSPNAVMEYMATGLPTVATDVGGNRELVEPEQTGLLVPPNDEAGLVAAVGRLLDDRPLAARMGAVARQRAFACYSVQSQARRYEDFYHDLLCGKVRRR